MLPIALISMCCAVAPAQDGVPRTLISTDMQMQNVSLIRIEGDRVLYRDALGLLRSEPAARLLAITLTDDDEDSQALATPETDEIEYAILELADGQRLTGNLIPHPAEAPADETVRWIHPLLGPMEFTLEQIARILLSPDTVPASARGGTGDVIILGNGDRLEGFIESMGEAVNLEIGGEVRPLPLDRIAGIILANPPEPLAGTIVYLRDSSILSAGALAAADDGQVAIIPQRTGDAPPMNPGSESAAVPLPLVEVSAVLFDAESVAPLARLPIATQEPAGGRRWVPPVRLLGAGVPLLGVHDVELPGPTTVEWVLPQGAATFATTAELPRTMWNWGDCELIVSIVPAPAGGQPSSGSVEVFRARMNADAPTARILADIPAAARSLRGASALHLRIRIDPGLYGPIQDQIVLRRPLVRIDGRPG